MSSAAASVNKKRSAIDAGAAQGPAAKKATKDTSTPMPTAALASMAGVPGWQYPPLPMGMIPPPMPYCMPGNPFFPFMGMFPPFWLPAAAMAAASMPALAAASAVGAGAAGIPSLPGACPLPNPAAMWPMMGCPPVMPPMVPAVPAPCPPCPAERSCSAASSDVAFPSTSCANSVPTAGGIQSPASPPPLSSSPLSVCNGSSELPAEDDEFANFIDSFLLAGDVDGDLTDAAVSSGLKMFQTAGASGSGASSSGDTEGTCLTHSESHSLLHLLGTGMEMPGVC